MSAGVAPAGCGSKHVGRPFFEIAEDVIPGYPLLDCAGHVCAECTVHGGPRLLQACEQEGQVMNSSSVRGRQGNWWIDRPTVRMRVRQPEHSSDL